MPENSTRFNQKARRPSSEQNRRYTTHRQVQRRPSSAARHKAYGMRQGRGQKTDSKSSYRRLAQLTVSGIILVVVVVIKLTSPSFLEPYRQQLLQLMGQETDFVAAFSAVGRAVGGKEDVGDALNDAYVAVFGGQEVENGGESHVYTEESLPQNVSMTQEVLGFPYSSPVEGTVASGFGERIHPIEGGSKFHYGVDIEAPTDTVIRSFADGTVSVVGESAVLGHYITILHDNGISSLYAHCSRITASYGQQVRMSDPIAEVGQSGQATGPHLHFELCRNGRYLNPIYYV